MNKSCLHPFLKPVVKDGSRNSPSDDLIREPKIRPRLGRRNLESVRQMKNRHGWIVKMSVKNHCPRNLKEADQTDKEDEYVLH